MKPHEMEAVRKRIKKLKAMYCQLSKTQEKDGTWDWWIAAEIDALEQELAVAQLKVISEIDEKDNVVRPLIASWQ